MHDRGVDHQVVVDELGGPRAVGEDAADRAGDEVHRLGPIGPEPVVDRGLVAEIELIARGRQRRDSVLLEAPDDGRADEAAMTCDEHRRIGTFRQYLCSVYRKLPNLIRRSPVIDIRNRMAPSRNRRMLVVPYVRAR